MFALRDSHLSRWLRGELIKPVPMDNLQAEIGNLSDKELQGRLQALGERFGPINKYTRKVMEKKLLKRLGGAENEQEGCEAQKPQMRCREEEAEVTEGTPPASIFYGVQIAPSEQNEKSCVLTKEDEFRKFLKRNPTARFKKFRCLVDAQAFVDGEYPSPKPLQQPEKVAPVEGSEFRSVRVQDLMHLGREIEQGKCNSVEGMVWSNPRYLIANGDTPTILKIGPRYNAFHCASVKNQAEVCSSLLNILSSMDFYSLLYPSDSDATQHNRMQYVLDMYLNMPDKGMNESPLHFACKFGHYDVVKILASHPKTDKTLKNCDGKTPREVICSRISNPLSEKVEKIAALLEDQFFVPLFRSQDDSVAPCLGKAWSPTVSGRTLNDSIQKMDSPRESLSVSACAGPMSPSQAEQFRKTWLTPPSPSPADRKELDDIRRGDFSKGMERIGRSLADRMQISWTEHWDFLQCFTDITSANGLQKLEQHLKQRQRDADQKQQWENNLNSISDDFSQLTLESSQTEDESEVDLNVTPNFVQFLNIQQNENERGTRTDSFKQQNAVTLFQINSHTERQRNDSFNSDCSFVTAAEEFDEEDGGKNDLNKDSNTVVYLITDEPCKTDLDVYRALMNVSIPEADYPCVNRWFNNVRNHSDYMRNRWRTPRKTKPNTSRTPLRLQPTSPEIESPPSTSDNSLSEEEKEHSFNNIDRLKTNLLVNFNQL